MSSPSAGQVVGVQPWFPWPLNLIPWLNAPVPAERLAAVRIGLGLLLLVDILATYLPDATIYFGRDTMGDPELFAWVFNRDTGRGNWSILQDVTDPTTVRAIMVLWAVVTVTMILGLCTRLSTLVAWVISISVASANTYIDNAGDGIRTMVMPYLFLAPSGAALSLDSWLGRRYRLLLDWPGGLRLDRRPVPLSGPALIYPWPLCLIVVQMCWIYFGNGFFKIAGSDWPQGNSLYFVLGDLTLTRFSYAQVPVPLWLTRVMSKTVLYWELFFPLLLLTPWKTLADLVERAETLAFGRLESAGCPRWFLLTLWPLRQLHHLLRWNRELTLLFGVLFHLGIATMMEIGGFPFYLISLYLQFLPWERFGRAIVARRANGERSQA